MIGKYIWHKTKYTITEYWLLIVWIMAAIGLAVIIVAMQSQESIVALSGVLLLLPGMYVVVYLCYILLFEWIIETRQDYKKFKEAQSKDGELE